MQTKIICFLVFLFAFASIVNANEDQMNNEYYSREQCVKQVLRDIKTDFNICTKTKTQLDCALSDTEINSMITVFCGEKI